MRLRGIGGVSTRGKRGSGKNNGSKSGSLQVRPKMKNQQPNRRVPDVCAQIQRAMIDMVGSSVEINLEGLTAENILVEDHQINAPWGTIKYTGHALKYIVPELGGSAIVIPGLRVNFTMLNTILTVTDWAIEMDNEQCDIIYTPKGNAYSVCQTQFGRRVVQYGK